MAWRVAAVIGLVLFTVGAMEYPFSGGVRIGTGAFELILERFETSKLSNPDRSRFGLFSPERVEGKSSEVVVVFSSYQKKYEGGACP